MTETLEREASQPATGVTTTPVTMAQRWAREHPTAVAMREKDLGVWQEITWESLWDQITTAAHGLLALGVGKGDRVSIHSEDRPEWIILDLATVAIRGITVGLYPTNPPAEVLHLLRDAGSILHLVEDQEQADKVVEVMGDLPDLRTIIHVEPRGFREWRDDDRFLHWDDFMLLGREHHTENPGLLDEIMAAAQPDDVITLVYTSGTTGPPKGAMLTNQNFIACVESVILCDGRIKGNRKPGPDDLVLTYLPLCHVAERIFSTWTMVSCGTVLNFAESIDTVQQNLSEIQPTLFFAVPRIWEKLHAAIQIRGNDATWFKRQLFRLGSRMAQVIGRERVANDGLHTGKSRLLYLVGYPLIFRPLKERIGLRRARWAGSGAAAIAPEVITDFIGYGVPLYELYGMTENAAIATNNFHRRNKVGTVGEPYHGTELKLDEVTGEILTKNGGTFLGYWNQPEATEQSMTPDGFLRTGDVGDWVEGTHIKVVDRIKHIIITSGGKNISPSEIENTLKTSPYVKEAMVVGDGRRYLTALVGIEFDTTGDWATRKGIPYTTYRDLSEKAQVVELVSDVVKRANEKFSNAEGIKKFRLLPKELDHEDGELTATQKVKRNSMGEMFDDLVEEMYR